MWYLPVLGGAEYIRAKHHVDVFRCSLTGELSAEESEIPQCDRCGRRYHVDVLLRCEICRTFTCGDCRDVVGDLDVHKGQCRKAAKRINGGAKDSRCPRNR